MVTGNEREMAHIIRENEKCDLKTLSIPKTDHGKISVYANTLLCCKRTNMQDDDPVNLKLELFVFS